MPPSSRNAYLNREMADSVKILLRVWFWHITFYLFHLIQLPFILLIEGADTTRNFGFWSFTSPIDQVLALCCLSNIILTYFYRVEYNLPIFLTVIMFYTILFRTFKIATRYMYMSVDSYNLWFSGRPTYD